MGGLVCSKFSKPVWIKKVVKILTVQPDYQLIAKYCNLWRNYLDIDDSWESVSNIIEWFAQDNGNLSAAAGPGHFNDPDMVIQ